MSKQVEITQDIRYHKIWIIYDNNTKCRYIRFKKSLFLTCTTIVIQTLARERTNIKHDI